MRRGPSDGGGVRARAGDGRGLLGSGAIDVVLNLTPPAAHAPVTRAALDAGKHVYSEKPLGTTVSECGECARLAAESRGLRLGCAPDIFLSGVYQKARSLLDEGAIGEPLAVSAAMLSGGQETWHPDPDIFFRDGAGPLLDMGRTTTAIVSLLKPYGASRGSPPRSSGSARSRSARGGERFTAETPTHISSMLEPPAARRPCSSRRSSLRALRLDDARARVRRRARPARSEWVRRPDPDQAPARRLGTGLVHLRGAADARGFGVHDMVEADRRGAGAPHDGTARNPRRRRSSVDPRSA